VARRLTTSAIAPEAVGDLLRDASAQGPSAARRLAQRERLVRSAAMPAARPSTARWGLAIGSLFAAAAVALFLVAPRTTTEAPLAEVAPATQPVESEWFAAPPVGAIAIDVGDGSRLQLVDGARGRMTRGSDDARLVLEAGLLQAEVEPTAGRRWTIEAGPYRVRVVGTIFTVDWDPATGRLDVEVQRGKVEVVGPHGGSPIPVDAGHRLRASLPEATAVLGEIPATTAEPADDPPTILDDDRDDGPPTRKKKPAVEPAPEAAPSWQALAHDARYADAFAIIEATGFTEIAQHCNRSALALLADTARLAKHPAEAKQAYGIMRDRFPGTREAAHAAFKLGRHIADHGGDRRDAVKWFRTSLAEAPRGSFAAEARGRLVQLLSAAGDEDGARAAARDYLEHHPKGPHAKLARSLLPP
jgi:transmembrane sensor